jgi:hypothetical protein
MSFSIISNAVSSIPDFFSSTLPTGDRKRSHYHYKDSMVASVSGETNDPKATQTIARKIARAAELNPNW